MIEAIYLKSSINQSTFSFIFTPSPLCIPVLTLTPSTFNAKSFFFQFFSLSLSNACKIEAIEALSPSA